MLAVKLCMIYIIDLWTILATNKLEFFKVFHFCSSFSSLETPSPPSLYNVEWNEAVQGFQHCLGGGRGTFWQKIPLFLAKIVARLIYLTIKIRMKIFKKNNGIVYGKSKPYQ